MNLLNYSENDLLFEMAAHVDCIIDLNQPHQHHCVKNPEGGT